MGVSRLCYGCCGRRSIDARAGRIAAPTQVEDLLLSPRAVPPVLKWDRVWRSSARRADVDVGQDQDGGRCVGEKQFRRYVRARRKRSVMAASGDGMREALKDHHGYME
jgi:hypothetical protein